MNQPKYYLINGSTENWHTAFSKNPPVWGFTTREKNSWEALQSGDIIYFYASGTARGIIGKGMLLNKFHGENPIWPAEIESGFSKWPWRFYFNPLSLLHPDNWKAGKGPILCSEFGISGTSLQGKQIITLEKEQIEKIDNKMSLWRSVIVGTNYTTEYQYLQPQTSEPQTDQVINIDPHTELMRIIEDMGKLQNFYTQTEFSIPNENRRIDVIWMRDIRGVPTYAFEIELSCGIDKALNKLYTCYKLWNTYPRLIAPSQDHEKIEKISMSLGFKDKVISILPDEIKDIYNKKRNFKDLEKRIGLF